MTDITAAVHPDPNAQQSTRARLAAAADLLRQERAEIPENFATLLFGRAAPEDLLAYTPAELTILAREAWAFMNTRRRGVPKIRLESPPATDGRLKSVAVLEIVTDDMPFLLHSVMGELTERGLDIRLVAHPVLAAMRDRQSGALAGRPTEAHGRGGELRESFIHVHVERIDDAQRRADIVAALERVLADVRVCVQDWPAMIDRVNAVIADLKANPPMLPVDDIAEAIQFLEWLIDNNFTLLGVRDHVFAGKQSDLVPVRESGLGLLRDDVPLLTRGGKAVTVTPQLLTFFDEPKTLLVTKANAKSRVHRRVYLDYIGVKRFDPGGHPIGEFRIVGLFTSTVYVRSTRSIPYLRRKTDAVVRREGVGECARKLSARRAVPDRPGYALPIRADHPAA
jgi:glutamate dehydrogenase